MRIGVFCSGGDAPGMNACVRGIVRAAAGRHEVVGIRRGYQGLLDEDFVRNAAGEPILDRRAVSGWARYGGTFLRSSRSPEFRTAAGQERGAEILRRYGVDALIPIGGDGTFHGAVDLADHWDGQIVGCPGTIDNDLMGTDFTIGFATAVQTAVDAVDKVHDTAESHQRMFLIEVMGRHSGYIAVYTALAASAEIVCIPEIPTDIGAIVGHLHELKRRGKASIMMVVAEGDDEGSAEVIHRELQAAGCPYPSRVLVLGHLQRGGHPAPADRILASQLGTWAVDALEANRSGVMVGNVQGQPALTPFAETYAEHKPIPATLLKLLSTLAT